MKQILLQVIAVILLLPSCKKKLENDIEGNEDDLTAVPYIRLKQNTITLPPVPGAEAGIVVESNVDWTVSLAPQETDWLHVLKTTGRGKDTIRLKVIKDNDGGQTRTATVSIATMISGTFSAQTVTIEQKAYSVKLLSQKLFGGTELDYINSMTTTADGGYILAGYTFSNTHDVHGNHGASDFWVVRLNGNFDTLWTKTLGGTGYEYANSIIASPDGGCAIAGASGSINGDVHNNHGADDCWIVKLDSKGDMMWTKSLGGSGFDRAHAIIRTFDQGYLVAGESNSRNSGDVGATKGNTDGWVVKLDSLGRKEWQIPIGGLGNDVFKSITDAGNYEYVISGYTESNKSGDVDFSKGSRDVWVVKLNLLTRAIIWSRNFGGSASETATSIGTTADGKYIVAGYTKSNNSGDIGHIYGDEDIWVLKLNNNGDTVWTKLLGGKGLDRAFNSVITPDGGCVLTGFTTSNDSDVSGNNGAEDGWVVKLSSSGQKLWTKSFGGKNSEQMFAVVNAPTGGYVLAGFSTSSQSFDVTSVNHGGYDWWVVKLTDQ
jgi:hypothetical protein